MEENGFRLPQGKLLHQVIKQLVLHAKDLKELEKQVNSVLDDLPKNIRLAFIAGPISAKTKWGKKWNRKKLDILTIKIAQMIQDEDFMTLSCAITPQPLEKFSVNNFYNMYDRISDRGERLYLTGNWRKSKGCLGEYERAKKRSIEIFEVKEMSPIGLWVPMWFRKIKFIKIN